METVAIYKMERDQEVAQRSGMIKIIIYFIFFVFKAGRDLSLQEK